MNCLTIFYCINLLYFVTSVELKDKSTENTDENVFIPTHEWQVVKKGQPIPKGLHVRINLETGLTEAKLLEDELKDEKKSALLTINQPEKEEIPVTVPVSKESITEALKNIKNEDLTPDDEAGIKRVTSKFKKYEEIKKELEHINLTPKTDIELLRELLKRYEEVNANKVEGAAKNVEIYNILEDIEYLVHQIDNANEFIRLEGFEKIIYSNFNSTNPKIKCQVLNILGSSVQNNPQVQIHALETGCTDKLSRLLALETNNEVLCRTIYAISSLLRRFPLAQQQFVKSGGLSVFSEIFEKSDRLKVQIRIITLLYDLITEHNNAIKHTENPDYKEKLKQYNNVNLKYRLKNFKWCDIFCNVLKNIFRTDENDHDSIEKCLNVINTVKDICLPSFNKTDVRTILNELNVKYTSLAEHERKENLRDTDVTNHMFYFQKMKEFTETLIDNLSVKTEL